MTRTTRILLLFGWTVVAQVCVAQTKTGDGLLKLDIDERSLRETYNVELTETGLIAGLYHIRPDVRAAVGLKLATDGYKSSVPQIIAALKRERFEGTQISLATAAAQLAAEEGFTALKTMCENSNWSSTLRMVAAQSMLQLGREECRDAVLSILPSTNDSQAAAIALSLLPRFRMISSAQRAKIEEHSALFLRSDLPAVRGAASHAMREFGDSWALAQLKGALTSESNEGVRNLMVAELAASQ